MKKIRSFIIPTLCILTACAVWFLAESRWAVADPPSLLDAGAGPGPAAETVGIEPTQPSILDPVLAPESDASGFVKVMTDMARTSWPGFAVFAALAIVGVVRRHLKQAREGTTGVATATALAFLTVVAGSIAMGVPIGQALGGGLVALLTGRAFATQVSAKAGG